MYDEANGKLKQRGPTQTHSTAGLAQSKQRSPRPVLLALQLL